MNFGTKLAIWDLLFGTAYLPPPAERKPTGYGLTYVEFPKGYLRQNLFAFRPLRKKPNPQPKGAPAGRTGRVPCAPRSPPRGNARGPLAGRARR